MTRSRMSFITLLSLMLVTSGCYHAVVNTGAAPAGTPVTHTLWANGWIAGLIPPKPVDAVQMCSGAPVARVETQHTILNMLVAGLTASIYTPMTIEVTCAPR
jgi:hypothetical protein